MASSIINPFDFRGSYPIIVITATDKITHLWVKDSDTIGNVKAKMGDFAHLLVFNGVALEDSRTLVELNISNGSVLTRIDMAPHGKMEIFVHTFTKTTISLLVSPTDTIANVKLWIMYRELVPVDEQVLIFNGMALGDGGILYDFDVHEQSALTLVRRSSGFIKIFVKTFGGKVIPVKIHPSNTIGDVKSKIQGEVHVHPDEQELIFDETALNNIDIVANCNIKEKSILTLVRISTGHTPIFIKTQAGTIITMKVRPSYTVYKVKCMFEDIEGIPRGNGRFMFDGRQLKDSSTLVDCQVQYESTIYNMEVLGGD